MHIERNVREKQDGSKQRALYISIRCDCCPTLLTYEGEDRHADAQLRGHGWTIGSTGKVRCKSCTSEYATRVHAAIAGTHFRWRT